VARESRRKREARRFGVPVRLADMIRTVPVRSWKVAPWVGPSQMDVAEEMATDCALRLGYAPVFVADDVGAYFYEGPQDRWNWSDFPCCAPPFEEFFVEFSRPATVVINGEVEPQPAWCPERFGFLFHSLDVPGEKIESVAGEGGDIYIDAPGARWVLIAEMYCSWAAGIPAFTGMKHWLFVDEIGRIVEPMQGMVLSADGPDFEGHPISDRLNCFLWPALLALSFMNCRGVTLDAVEADARVNRERRRAGMQPFVRYRTINIGPIKRVLGIGGGSGSVGLKKALHDVRGHFCVLTRNNKGEILEKPTLYFRKDHMRGSIKQGVVVSDYRVKP
jgi:hypothetical protein